MDPALQAMCDFRGLHLNPHAGTALLHGSLEEMEAARLAFVRTHKSYLVNPRHIRALPTGNVIIMEGESLQVSRRYKEKTG